MAEGPTSADPEWAPMPDTGQTTAATRNRGPQSVNAFGPIIVGGFVIAVDVNVDGFDLLADAAGYGAVAFGASKLRGTSERFNLTLWAAVISGIFALATILNADAGTPTIFVDQMPTQAEGAWAIVSRMVEFISGSVLAWSLIVGIGEIAFRRGERDLSDRADSIRRWFVIATAVFALFFGAYFAFGVALGVIGVIAIVGYLVVYVRIALLLFAAGRSLPIGPDPELSELPKPLEPVVWFLVVGGVLTAVLYLLFPPSIPVVAVEQSETANVWGPEPDAPIIERQQALERQPATLVPRPNAVIGNGPVGCSQAAQPVLTAVEQTTGRTQWSMEVPGLGPAPVSLNGELVLLIDPILDTYPPSVTAIEAATGEVHWQRFIDADRISL